jgi:hypothetical protein
VVLVLSSDDEHGTARVLHHSRRNAPEENPGNGAQPFDPHHNQIGWVCGGHLHDRFSRPPKLIHRLGCNPRLDQLPHAPFDRPAAYSYQLRVPAERLHMDHARMNRYPPALAGRTIRLKLGQHKLQCLGRCDRPIGRQGDPPQRCRLVLDDQHRTRSHKRCDSSTRCRA